MVPGERMHTRNSHGTGCSLSSAMATVQAADRGTGKRRCARSSRGCRRRSAKPRPARRRHRQRPGPSLPPPPAAHPGPWPPGRARHRPRASSPPRCGKPPPPTSRRSMAWTSSGPSPTARCRRRSSPTTSPRTPCTSTAIPGCWPVPPPSHPLRPSSCSGPARRRTASKSSRSCTGPGSAPARPSVTLGPGHQVVRGPPAGRLGLRQLRGAGGRGASVLLALRRGRGDPAPASSSPRAPRRRIPTPCGCAPTPTRTSPPPPGRPSRTPTPRRGRPRTGERDAMTLAFRQSARYEVDFFDAPRLHA